MENSRPHNSKLSQECIRASEAEQLPHPVHSPDIAPSDFFLFGYIKRKMSEYNCESRQDVLKIIAEFFSQINKARLISVFESWIQWL
jgi:hypothetical protein